MNAELSFKSKMENFQLYFMHLVIKLSLIRNSGNFLKRSVFIALELVMLFIGIWYLKIEALTIGSLIAFSNYSARLSNSISSLIRVYSSFNEVTVSIDRIGEMKYCLEIKNDDTDINKEYNDTFIGVINFYNVSFNYNDNVSVFENISLSFKPGKINIILGDSGIGKSTIFKLLLKLYSPKSGSIYFNDTNIKDISSFIIRHNIAYAPQNPYFFNVTISENIKYANPNLTDEQIINILQKVNLYDFVSSLPNNIEKIMQESGENFSEGQKQRLNIARIIAKNSQIYLLDEPTSSLDRENRNDILQIIQNLGKNSTVIMITHDRELINNFNDLNIIELDKLIYQSA